MNIWFISMDFHSACINCAWAFMGSSDLCCCLNYEHLPHAMASSNESIMDYGKLTSHATIRFHSARSGSAWLSFQLTFNCFHQFNSIACMFVCLCFFSCNRNWNWKKIKIIKYSVVTRMTYRLVFSRIYTMATWFRIRLNGCLIISSRAHFSWKQMPCANKKSVNCSKSIQFPGNG